MSAAERTQAGEAEHELAESVRLLTDRIEALQADVRRLGGPALPTGEVGWEDGSDGGDDYASSPSYSWVGALEPRVRRRPTVPRLALEGLFLVAVAVGCGLAELDALVIAAVMAGAWVLVALIEWASSVADARRDDIVVTFATRDEAPADPSWFVPPVEHTMLEPGAPDDATVVARLPELRDDDEPAGADEREDEQTQH